MSGFFAQHASYYIYVLTLLVSLLSMGTSFLVVILYYNYSAFKNPSRLLRVIITLIFTDGAVGFCVLLWEIFNHVMGGAVLDTACQVLLPIPIFFFIAGYLCSVLVCLRFLQMSQQTSRPLLSATSIKHKTISSNSNSTHHSTGQDQNQSQTPSWSLYTPPLRTVWAIAFAFTLPILVLNCGVLGADYAISRVILIDDATGLTYCMFDPTTWLSRGVNFLCFQLPLLLTIVINITAFVMGMRALQYSPQSVIAREMKRVGQYLFVLLIIWVPNLLSNMMQWLSVRKDDMTFKGRSYEDEDDDELHVTGYYGISVGVMILLTSLQGLLNATVYALSHRSFSQYLTSGLLGLVEEDYFSSGRAAEPLLQSFDDDEEPFTQNGYKCKVTYSLGDEEGGEEKQQQQATGGVSNTNTYHPPNWDMQMSPSDPRPPLSAKWQASNGRGDSYSASSTTSHQLTFPFSPNSSIDPTGDRYSKDSVTDAHAHKLLFLSRSALDQHASELDARRKYTSAGLVGSHSGGTTTTASMHSSPSDFGASSTLSPPPGGWREGVSLYRTQQSHDMDDDDDDEKNEERERDEVRWRHASAAVPIPSGGGVMSGSGSTGCSSDSSQRLSLRSSLKNKSVIGSSGSSGLVVSPRQPGGREESPETRQRALSDSEKVVRFDINSV